METHSIQSIFENLINIIDSKETRDLLICILIGFILGQNSKNNGDKTQENNRRMQSFLFDTKLSTKECNMIPSYQYSETKLVIIIQMILKYLFNSLGEIISDLEKNDPLVIPIKIINIKNDIARSDTKLRIAIIEIIVKSSLVTNKELMTNKNIDRYDELLLISEKILNQVGIFKILAKTAPDQQVINQLTGDIAQIIIKEWQNTEKQS